MDPITGFSLILALIPFWQRERDKKDAATKDAFYTWLIDHNFECLKDCIESNSVLLVQIEDLLKLNQDELLHRFDVIDEKLMMVLYGIDEFRDAVKYLCPHATLSKNEEYILTAFVESGENDLFFITSSQRNILQAGTQIIEGYNPRFVESNLQHLAEFGYIKLYNKNNNSAHYFLTESGEEYVKNIKSGESLSSQAKEILLQYYQTEEPFLVTFLNEHGKVGGVQANNITLSFSDPNYVHDDLDSLQQCGLIKYDGELNGGGRRYTRTRKGEEYVANILKGKTHADA